MNGQLVVPVNERDHIAGSLKTAAVVLVEYGDFECPHCGRAYPIVKAAQQRLGENLAFVFRHFPLEEIHPHAPLAAEASEAAGAQGKFWQMHAALFENQHALDESSLLSYARELGLDMTRFAQELTTHVYAGKVRDDFRGGVRSGVNGTPTFFIDGARFDGDWSDPELFIAVLERVAAAAQGSK
jgi:protein-disulfide isomerase